MILAVARPRDTSRTSVTLTLFLDDQHHFAGHAVNQLRNQQRVANAKRARLYELTYTRAGRGSGHLAAVIRPQLEPRGAM